MMLRRYLPYGALVVLAEFLAHVEQQLHAEADAQKRPAGCNEALHRIDLAALRMLGFKAYGIGK